MAGMVRVKKLRKPNRLGPLGAKGMVVVSHLPITTVPRNENSQEDGSMSEQDKVALDLPRLSPTDVSMPPMHMWNMIMGRLQWSWAELQRTNDERIKRAVEEALAERGH